MFKVRVIILRTAGTNCDEETKFAFEKLGCRAELLHINRLRSNPQNLRKYAILVIPGGFSYGDDIAAGKILANELKQCLKEELLRFIEEGKLILGICNGFQVLVKAGFLPGNKELIQEASLVLNESARFEDRWVYLRKFKTKDSGKNKCIWTEGLEEMFYLPVAHAEGRFVPKDHRLLEKLKKNGQIVFQYTDPQGNLLGYPWNPNGSIENIAGICDSTGRIFGLMPHPERYIFVEQHPRWQRKVSSFVCGMEIICKGVEYARRRL